MAKNAIVTCCVLGHVENAIQKPKNSNWFGKLIQKGHWDGVCLDEAGFCTLQDGVQILAHFKTAILAGDHLQLPPVVKSDDAKRIGFDKSFMEWMVEKVPSRHFLLDTQYRSHKMISGWSSKVLYDGKLKADKSNRAKRLIDSYQDGTYSTRAFKMEIFLASKLLITNLSPKLPGFWNPARNPEFKTFDPEAGPAPIPGSVLISS